MYICEGELVSCVCVCFHVFVCVHVCVRFQGVLVCLISAGLLGHLLLNVEQELVVGKARLRAILHQMLEEAALG